MAAKKNGGLSVGLASLHFCSINQQTLKILKNKGRQVEKKEDKDSLTCGRDYQEMDSKPLPAQWSS